MDTLRGSYGSRKAADAWIAEARGRVRLIRCYLQHIQASRHRQCACRLRRLAESGCLRRVLLTTALSLWRRAHFRICDHFRGRRKGNLVLLVLQSRLFVTGARDRRCLTSKCSFHGRCSTLDMVVIVEELRLRDRCSEP